VLSLDEKTQIQALDRTQPLLPIDQAWLQANPHVHNQGLQSMGAPSNCQLTGPRRLNRALTESV
jgi:hypothetical protein